MAKFQIAIKTSDRLFAAGMTGSGKTFAVRKLAAPLKRFLLFDTKGTLANWNTVPWDSTSRKLLEDGKPVRARLIAPLDNLADDEELKTDPYWTDAMIAAFYAGDVVIYVDELYAVIPNPRKFPRVLRAIYTRGREFNVGFWSAAQRPTDIPLFVISEADHEFMFRLNLDDDIKRMAGYMGRQVFNPIKQLHGFYYKQVNGPEPVQYYPSI